MKKLLKNNKFKQSVIVVTTLFLCLLMFLNVSYWGQQVINKVDEVVAEDIDAVSFDNNFDFNSSSEGTSYTSRYIYWSDFINDIDEDSIKVSDGTITITSDNNYIYGHSSDDNHKIIVLEDASNYIDFASKCVNEDANIRQFYLNNHYVLGNNIDFNKASAVEPIGNYNYPFTGIFDGQGFEMSNATLVEINATTSTDGTTSSESYLKKYSVGYTENDPITYYSRHSFFAYNNGTIKNLGNINPVIVQKTSFATIADNQNVESYASLLVGMNMSNGVISNVYTIDSIDFGKNIEENTLGITLSEGAISGLVGQNEGSVKDSYVIADYLFYYNNENIIPVDIQPVVVTNSNNGTFKDVYYNGTRYTPTSNGSSDSSYVSKTVTGVTELKLDNDVSFTNYTYFTNNTSWYQRKEETSSEYDYPKLVGIRTNDEQHLSLTTPYDFILMSELINDTSTIYNERTYSLDNSIDMRSLSKDIFTPISNSFKGTLMSSGTSNYYVYDLIINPSSSTKNIAIFEELEGATIKNISFYNTSISLTSTSTSDTYNVSLLTNDIQTSATISNVQLHGNVTLSNAGSTYFGGFASKISEGASIDISSCSVGGSFNGGSVVTSSTSYVGGFIGNINNSTSKVNISNSFNEMNIVTIGCSSISNSATVYTGGIIGYGYVNNIEKVGNKGNITSNEESKYPALKSYTGGIIGSLIGYYHDLITDTYGSFKQVTNDGNIVSYAYSTSQLVEMSGFGIVSFSSNKTDILNNLFYGITNNGTLTLINKGSISEVSQTLGSVGFFVTPGIIVNSTSVTINGLYNNKNQDIDIPLLPTYAPNLYTNNSSSYSINLSNSYNKGNLNFSLSNADTNLHHYYFGNTYGNYINFDCIRNEGYLFFNINYSISKTFQSNSKQFVIAGLFLEVSDGKIAKNLYNGGNIVVNHTETKASTVYGILYIGGICYKNANNSAVSSTTYASSWSSSNGIMIPSSLKGSLYNAVNNGNIFVYDTVGWGGTIRIGGIAVATTSLISDAANLGNIEVNANVTSTSGSGFGGAGQFEIEASGIVFLLLNVESNGYGALKDCVNYGNVITYNSTTTYVWTLSSGIVGRNDKGEYGNDASGISYNGWANRIEYCINYGNIYTLNKSSTTSAWNQATARASGFLGCGLLSIVNSINYGNVYSSGQAGGIICYTRTDAYSSPSFIFIANSINYGEIKNVTAYSVTWNSGNAIIKDQISSYIDLCKVTISTKTNGSSLANATGGIMAHFRPNSTTTDTTFSMFIISCLYNFSDVNLVGIVYMTGTTSLSGTATTKKLVEGMGTTYSSDSSPTPFNSTTRNYKYSVPNYTYDAGTSGIFSSSFPLNNENFDDGTVTAQYISDYIRYVPYQNVGGYNESSSIGLASKLSISSSKPGIYALSSSQGVATGILLPENIDLDSISPITSDGTRDKSWCGTTSETNSIKWKISLDMLQQKKSMASTIFDGELEATDTSTGNTYTLTDPIIDQDNKTITFYVADNDAGKFNGTYTFNFVSYAPNAKKHEELNSTHATYDTTSSDDQYVYCYSQAYSKDDSNFNGELYYSKYQIIVVNINDSKSMSVSSISIDGSSATYSTSSDTTTVSTTMQSGASGNILINLTTTNIADETELAKYVTIYRVNDSGKEIETYSSSSTSSLWTLDETNNGVVSVTSTTDVYSTGTASIKFTATNLTRGGKYLIKISLNDTSDTYVNIIFTKNKLTTASISNMVFNNKVVSTSSTNASSTIPFGTPIDVSDFTDSSVAGTNYMWYPNTFIGYRTSATHSEENEKTYYVTFEYETQMISIIPTDNSAVVYSYYSLTKNADGNSYTLSIPSLNWLPDFSVTYTNTSDNKYKLLLSTTFYSGSKTEKDVALNYTGGDIIVNDFSDEVEVEKALTQRTLFKPNYLSSLSLSTFTNIRTITYSYTIDSTTKAKTHKFVYTLLAENGSSTTTFTHTITEESSLKVTYLYVDGTSKNDEDATNDSYDVSIERTATPSILVYYDLSKYYIHDNCLSLSATYSEDGTTFNEDTTKCEAHIINNKYVVLDFNSDDPGYIKINLTYTSEDNRSVSFQEVLITKAKSSISLLKNISFSSDNSLTVQNTIVDYEELTESTYDSYYNTASNRRINVGVRSGINYGSYNDKEAYYIAGEVSDTDVSSYKPTFTLPTGSTIYLVNSDGTLSGDGTTTSDALKADYTNSSDNDFKFIRYRIFAEDYVKDDATYGTHYTDYYVAVVDKTYTVRFNVNVKFDSLDSQEKYYTSSKLIFITFIKYEYSKTETDISKLNIENYSTAISFLQNNDVNNKTGYYDSSKTFKECSFPSNKSGIFLIKLDLLNGYTFTYKVNNTTYAADKPFEAKALLVPRKFTVDITISTTTSTTTWGETSSATLH